jgi:hypothetical protein
VKAIRDAMEDICVILDILKIHIPIFSFRSFLISVGIQYTEHRIPFRGTIALPVTDWLRHFDSTVLSRTHSVHINQPSLNQ